MIRWTHLFVVAAIAVVVPVSGPRSARTAGRTARGASRRAAGRPTGRAGWVVGVGRSCRRARDAATIRFPTPIPATEGVITVKLAEFASLPDVGTRAARMNLISDEPGTRRLFVNVMTGTLFTVSYDGKSVAPYLDINDPKWATPVQANNTEQGFQSFAFHPQFAQARTPGYGKFYTWVDTSNTMPMPDFTPRGNGRTHDEILLEWTAKDPKAAAYDGGAPRELFRVAHPFPNHNGGQIAFNPLARPGTPEFGLLYIGSADGGSRRRSLQHVAEPQVDFRQDPAHRSAGQEQRERQVRHSPVESIRQERRRPRRDLLLRPPQPAAVLVGSEERQHVRGGDRPEHQRRDQPDRRRRQLRLERVGRQLQVLQPRGEHRGSAQRPEDGLPIAEYDHTDPILQRLGAATGIYAYRDKTVPQLTNKLIFGDNPSGEIFYVNADALPKGGQSFHRILISDQG